MHDIKKEVDHAILARLDEFAIPNLTDRELMMLMHLELMELRASHDSIKEMTTALIAEVGPIIEKMKDSPIVKMLGG